MAKTIAIFGAGPGLSRSVALRFGREGFRVALVARNRERLDALAAELAGQGIEAAGWVADLLDRTALPAVADAMTARFGPLDVLEYAPAGLDLHRLQRSLLDADVESFEVPLDLLLRSPVTLVRHLVPGMIERGDGAVLFGLAVTASLPFPQLANVGTATAAARGYLHNLHLALAGTGVYAGLLQVAGLVGGSEAARYFTANHDPAQLPEPLDPADLADACWDLYLKRDRFEVVVGPAAA
jgi:NADP-dependent 3-hydroxy acid dehydrogenase YdfG